MERNWDARRSLARIATGRVDGARRTDNARLMRGVSMARRIDNQLRDACRVGGGGPDPPGAAGALEQVAARYAVAITPAMAELIDPADPHDPIARQFVPDAARARDARRTSAPIRSATTRTARSKASCIAIPTACCSSSCMSARSIAASASAARWSGRAGGRRCRARSSMRRSPISARIREIWEVILTGGDPLVLSPRRLREVMRALPRSST